MIYFTSDTHLSHQNIIKYCNRPFNDVDHMNEMLIKNYNEVVQSDDTVFFLGDVAMGRLDDSLPKVSRLNGHKILVAGNHDRCWSTRHDERLEWERRYKEVGFEQIEYGEYIVNFEAWGLEVKLDHFPYEDDVRHKDRFDERLPINEGHWLLHGHVHNSWKVKENMINVGVDVWNYYPVSIETIQRIVFSTSCM